MGDEGDVVGFYAYGESTPDSDVDLLVVKAIYRNLTAVATVIRKALRPLRHRGTNLPLDIMVRDPGDFRQRVEMGAAFHAEIAHRGLVLA